ncbi:MAG: site-specific DNA-methyltransferase [Armatimonadetes bacterium CG07_land_8_20_14_0_80_40_9]|nr:MAG: site-specific DNA-methyltransferase [Armatimonadetes bacterium CG07_land_8_20_14_0_80_40_9]
MSKLKKDEIEFITQYLKQGKPLPDSYRYIIPFETKKEYELTYEGKEREEDILADTMAVPLQPVKTFGNGNGGWTNKLIFGDNLQVLKALMDDPEVYDKNTGRGKARLIYIDPPFGTGDIYDAKGTAPAYSAKLQGAKFIEFLRKRLVFLREILADDGCIYVRTDYHFGHYLKAIMDEVFEKDNFRNEILINKSKRPTEAIGQYHSTTDFLLFYTKTQNYYFKIFEIKRAEPKWRGMHLPGVRWTKIDKKYLHLFKIDVREKDGEYYSRARIFFGKEILPPEGRHWAITQENVFKLEKLSKIKLDEKGRPISIESDTKKIGDNWTDIPGYSRYWNYPTENAEEVLERVIEGSSKKGDTVLDAFAGSGTTGAVAEKLGRRWIMIDCGKLAIYTMQKRLLNLKEKIGNKGRPLKPKPFTLYNAGLYDYKMVKGLSWDKYREFVLKLFQCRDEKHRIAGVELDGYLGRDPVMVFNYKKHKNVVLDRGFIDDLHKILGDKVGYRFFIIVPAASVMFFEDYIEKGKTKYFVLRIPYSIIDELHRKGFTHIKQPIREADVNETIDAVGFDFIQNPDVECNYFIKKSEGQMELNKSNKEAVIKIKEFKSNILSKKPLKFENRETLSMVMVDYNYNGEVFDFDSVFYAENIKKQNWELRFDADKIDSQMMIIYIDIFGNEKREVKKLKDFKKQKYE